MARPRTREHAQKPHLRGTAYTYDSSGTIRCLSQLPSPCLTYSNNEVLRPPRAVILLVTRAVACSLFVTSPFVWGVGWHGRSSVVDTLWKLRIKKHACKRILSVSLYKAYIAQRTRAVSVSVCTPACTPACTGASTGRARSIASHHR